MIVQNLYHANLKIDAEGNVSLESAWELALEEPASGLEQLQAEARGWAGGIGEPFRIPAADGSYEFSETVLVTGIELKPVSLAVCRVIFSGAEFAAGGGEEPALAAAGSVVDVYETDGAHRRTMRFRASASVSPELIPQPGRPLEWEGGAFICESCRSSNSGFSVEFEVTAREATLAELGLPQAGTDGDGFETKRAVWFVAASEHDAFLADHPVGGAAAWAGEKFTLVSADSKLVGKIGFEVVLLARKVETRCIAKVRSEKFAGLSRSGAIQREIVWKVRWRVAAEELSAFYGQTGLCPADWTEEEECIITDISPKRLSEMEYGLDIEAQHPGNPGLFGRYSAEDRTNLSTRVDVSVDMAEFHVSAEMAGFQKLPDGRFRPILNWNSGSGCPFSADGRLAENMIESTLRCLVITESVYKSGDAARQIADLAAWAAVRVSTAAVAGASGSFLRIGQTCRETFSNSGKLYTRISRSYQKAPGDLQWNPNYWSSH